MEKYIRTAIQKYVEQQKTKGGLNRMTLTQKVKLLPTKEQQELIVKTMREYIALTNDILNYALALGEMPKLSSAKVCAALPSAL